MVELSKAQRSALDAIISWYFSNNRAPYFALAGYAGVGKTTIAKVLYDFMTERKKRCIFAAYTGKAAHVLNQKGCPAGTLHSLIYQYEGVVNGELMFGVNGACYLQDADLCIVDEYSMLDKEIVDDLLDQGCPVLFLGDPAQLPPISGDCPIVPNHELTEIHRQAEGSPIIRAATKVRNGEKLRHCKDGDFNYVRRHEVKNLKSLMQKMDQVICGYNVTRKTINGMLMLNQGGDSMLPLAGDKMICLKNARDVPLFNGLIGEATQDGFKPTHTSETYEIEFNGERCTAYYPDLLPEAAPLGRAAYDRGIQRFDYAYAITAHKAQGSEFDKLIVLNEPVGRTAEDKQKWLYTAITRGRQKVNLIDM